MTPHLPLLPLLWLALLVPVAAWVSGARYGRRKERSRMNAIGWGEQPAVRQQMFRQAWEQYQEDQPQVTVVDLVSIPEPNMRLLKD